MSISPSILYSPCPCGSGKKFKFCHFEEVRNELRNDPTQSDVTMAVRKAMQPFGMVNDVDPIEDREAIRTMFAAMKDRDAGRMADALAGFRKAREMTPKLMTAWNNEAQCLWMMEMCDEAVARQEEGLSRSADSNAFGWAQLAVMNHCLGRTSARDLAIDRAKAIAPISPDAAVKVCEALGLAERHRELLDYALASGFIDTPAAAFMAGVAAANCGRREQALELLASVGDDPLHGDRAATIAAEVKAGRKETASPLGTWPYLEPDGYLGMVLVKRAFAAKVPPKLRNVVCDLIEMTLAEGSISDEDSISVLVACGGSRAGRLVDAIQARMEVPECAARLAGKTKDGTTSVERRLIAETAFEDYPLSKADDKIFRRATRSFQTARPGTKTFEKAKNDLAELLKRYPDYHRLQFNYASALERAGERDKARRLVERIVAEHPDYAFARAALLDSAVQDGDFARAKEIYDAFHIPTRIHPQELRAWLRSSLRYAEAAGLEQETRRIRRELDALLKAFPDM